MTSRIISAVSMTIVLLATLPAWGLDFKPGKYEITSKVEMSGVPGAAGGKPSQTITQCLTEQDPVPNTSAGAQGCKVTEVTTEGNKVTYSMECNQQGAKMKTTGEITYKGESFEGTSKLEIGSPAGGMTIVTEVKGKRIGDCD